MRNAKVAVTRVAVAVIIAVGVVLGGAGLYYYTSPQVGVLGTPSTNAATPGPGGTPNKNATGSQDSTGQPLGSWAMYLGYIPQGYVVAPHQSNAPSFPCPPEMSTSACALFKQTCGNGVCDPNESCSSCPMDCAPTGNLSCDPYTGRPGVPASVCQAAVADKNSPP